MRAAIVKVTGLILLGAGAFGAAPVFAWTTHIDCEGGTIGAHVQDGVANSWSSSFGLTTYSTDQVGTGKQSCKMGVTQGSDGWGQFGATYIFPSTLKRGAEVWTRVSLYIPSSFNVTTNTGVLKFMRVHTASSSGGNEGYHDLLISNPGTTQWDAGVGNWTASYIYNYEGFAKLIGVGTVPTNDFVKGKWETYEIYVKLDSTSKDAGGMGEVRIWKNNTLLLDRTNTATLVGSTSVADAFYLFTYWNGNAPATQSLYVDDVIVTSDTPANKDSAGHPFIGGTTPKSAAAPMPPTLTGVQ